jgi:hypothetical protein
MSKIEMDLRPCWEADPELWDTFCWATDRPDNGPSDLWTVHDVNAWFDEEVKKLLEVVDALIMSLLSGPLH